jgi:hypothetical protein
VGPEARSSKSRGRKRPSTSRVTFEDKGKEEIEKKRKRPDSESGGTTRKQRYKNVVHYIF